MSREPNLLVLKLSRLFFFFCQYRSPLSADFCSSQILNWTFAPGETVDSGIAIKGLYVSKATALRTFVLTRHYLALNLLQLNTTSDSHKPDFIYHFLIWSTSSECTDCPATLTIIWTFPTFWKVTHCLLFPDNYFFYYSWHWLCKLLFSPRSFTSPQK